VRIFVTGVSSGIGRELVKILLHQEHEVWGIARRLDALESLAGELNSPTFTYDQCDTADEAATASLFAKMSEQNYLPDIVILNAAVDLEDTATGLDFNQSCRMMRTNVDGAYFWITAFIDTFMQRGSGQFIAISSLFANWPDAASVSYSGSKAALSMVMRGLRLRYIDTDLKFKLLYLGPVDTPINPRFSEDVAVNSLIVSSAPSTASYIVKIIDSKRNDFYFPLYIALIFTFLRWLPDKWFEFLTGRFKR
jgi:short-subunit dehydrogenase